MTSGTGARNAWFMLIFVILTWGVNWPIMKFALSFVGPLNFALWRTILGVVTLFAVALMAGQLRFPARKTWPFILTVGVLHYGLHFLFVSMGLHYVEAGRSAILVYTTPLWVVPLAVMFLGERMRGLEMAGVITGFAGILLLFNPQALDWSSREAVLGNLSLLLAAIFWALSIFTVKKMKWDENPIHTAPWACLTGLAVIAPPALILGESSAIPLSADFAAAMLYNGIVANGLTFVAFTFVNQKLSAIHVSVGLLAIPVVGLVSSAIVMHEPVGFTKLISMILVVSGIALMTVAGHRMHAARALRKPSDLNLKP